LEFIGMVNILAGRQVVHEFVQGEASAGNVTSFLESAMTDAVLRAELSSGLLETAALLGEGGAARRAADAIVSLLN
jgi:lipid-A-disaccharide synthase